MLVYFVQGCLGLFLVVVVAIVQDVVRYFLDMNHAIVDVLLLLLTRLYRLSSGCCTWVLVFVCLRACRQIGRSDWNYIRKLGD
jgi:hypothetical protein